MKLKEYLKQRKITQSELAEKLGVKKQTIYSQMKYWDNGGTPTMRSILAWSKALKISQQKFYSLICK